MKRHYDMVLLSQQTGVDAILANQIKDLDSIDCGGFADHDKLVHPGRSAENLLYLTALYCNADSSLYRDNTIFTNILRALAYLERIQRADGTYDLIVTNFNSSPDTGFIIQNLAYVYQLAKKYSVGDETDIIKQRLFDIIYRGAHGMTRGGFHTPNHRWVIASALMMAFNITGEGFFRDAANTYLREGIDCDENGEFTERSSGIYNATNDHALIILSQETGRVDFLEYVKRNLDMMFTYIEPDGTVFTANSTRQDKAGATGNDVFYPYPYYPLYLYMAWKKSDCRYAGMANSIFNQACSNGQIPSLVYFFMLHPELKDFHLASAPIPDVYNKFFKQSGIVRVRNGKTSYTLLKNNSRFLFYQNGSLRCYMKLCASFFASAQFKAEDIIKTETGYKLSFSTQGSYRLPLDKPPTSPDWSNMDHASRKKVNIMELRLTVEVVDTAGTLHVHITSEGCDRVPVKVEVCFTADSTAEGDSFFINGAAGGSIIVKSGYTVVKKGTDKICVGPGFAEHVYAPQMRGSEPQSTSEFTIYFSDFTPLNRELLLSSHFFG